MTMLQIQVDVRYKMATNIHAGYKHSVYEYEVLCMFYTYMAKTKRTYANHLKSRHQKKIQKHIYSTSGPLNSWDRHQATRIYPRETRGIAYICMCMYTLYMCVPQARWCLWPGTRPEDYTRAWAILATWSARHSDKSAFSDLLRVIHICTYTYMYIQKHTHKYIHTHM